ncbi:dihydrodipicolinate reductase [Anopheles sinensis]|uniref:Dihydrodipicolinate reductase n=1 Tax=Anopheles sinensis TaxID=74873 RepID=A0A084VPA8_ANOSI|nr:dihydrodipicolinate reductase [Anopheles sinensis]
MRKRLGKVYMKEKNAFQRSTVASCFPRDRRFEFVCGLAKISIARGVAGDYLLPALKTRSDAISEAAIERKTSGSLP